MKDVFLVHITLPDVFTPSFYDKTLKQRNYINGLLEKQVILSYSLDMERKNIWMFMSADSEHEIMDILSTFPIIQDVSVRVHELAFHDAAHAPLPDLIMN